MCLSRGDAGSLIRLDAIMTDEVSSFVEHRGPGQNHNAQLCVLSDVENKKNQKLVLVEKSGTIPQGKARGVKAFLPIAARNKLYFLWPNLQNVLHDKFCSDHENKFSDYGIPAIEENENRERELTVFLE